MFCNSKWTRTGPKASAQRKRSTAGRRTAKACTVYSTTTRRSWAACATTRSKSGTRSDASASRHLVATRAQFSASSTTRTSSWAARPTRPCESGTSRAAPMCRRCRITRRPSFISASSTASWSLAPRTDRSLSGTCIRLPIFRSRERLLDIELLLMLSTLTTGKFMLSLGFSF